MHDEQCVKRWSLSLRRDGPASRAFRIRAVCGLASRQWPAPEKMRTHAIRYACNQSRCCLLRLILKTVVSGRSPFVPVMQPAHFGNGDNAAGIGELYTPSIGRILLQCEVRASPVIVKGERLKVPGQTSLVENDHVIEAFATNCANDPFDIRTLPWRAWRRQHLFDSHGLHLLDEFMS